MQKVTADLLHEVIDIRRVGKVTKGGKRLRFRVVVVAGDGAGRVGVGVGKSVEIPQAVQQGIRDAMKRLVTVPVQNGTVPHEVVGEFGAAKVLLKPAHPGTGVIAGRTVGAMCRVAGLQDILTKALRSTNPLNLARATLDAFRKLESAEMVAARRGKTVAEIVEVQHDQDR